MQTSPGVRYLLHRIGRAPRLERTDEQAQVARACHGDREAIGHLLGSNLAYVVRIAMEFRGRGVPFEDLIADGCVGLLKAIHHYRAVKGTRFMTYASFWVRKEILAALEHQPHTVYVPRYARTHGSGTPRILRLDVSSDSEENFSLADRLRHPDPLPAQTIITNANVRALRRHVLRLAPRDRAVIASRYGLGGEPEQTLNEIALRLGISRERVRQIEVAALASLRHAIAGNKKHRRRSLGSDRPRSAASASSNV